MIDEVFKAIVDFLNKKYCEDFVEVNKEKYIIYVTEEDSSNCCLINVDYLP